MATDAVRMASTLCQEVQGQLMRQDEQAVTKDDKSLVTLADYAAQAIISWRIQQEWPDFTMVGEEDAETLVSGGEGGAETLRKITALVNKTLRTHKGDDAPELSTTDLVTLIDKGKGSGGMGRHWVLDPVDGTLGFVRGDQYAIALALMEEGELKVGAMGCPNMPKMGEVLEYDSSYTYGFSPRLVSKMLAGEALGWFKGCLFTAVKGQGAFMIPCDASLSVEPVPVSCSATFDPKTAKFCEPVMKANSSQGFTASVADNLAMTSKPLRVYSQVKYGSVARADADVFEVPQSWVQGEDLGPRRGRDHRGGGGRQGDRRRRRAPELGRGQVPGHARPRDRRHLRRAARAPHGRRRPIVGLVPALNAVGARRRATRPGIRNAFRESEAGADVVLIRSKAHDTGRGATRVHASTRDDTKTT